MVASTFAVTRTGLGWTMIPRSRDSRVVFVSSSTGHDGADGLTRSTPKRTIFAAVALLRHGFPDHLLLRRGDTFHEPLGHWKLSGRSEAEPMVIGAYGIEQARPTLLADAAIWTNGGGGSPATIDHLAIIGIAFKAETHAGGPDCVGARFLQPLTNLLIEDCLIQGYGLNLVLQGFQGRHTNVVLRRSVVVDAWTVKPSGGHSQGLYAYAVDGLAIDECVFDHNGWAESPGAGPDIYSHGLYIDNGCTGVSVRGSIVSRSSSHGLMLRCGGTAAGNLFARNAIALSVGGGEAPEPGGVVADVRRNVIVEGTNIDDQNPRGWGLWLGNIRGGTVMRNVIANNLDGLQPASVILDGTLGVHAVLIEGNTVFDWGTGIEQSGDISGTLFSLNDWTGDENYLDPERSIADYSKAIGGAGTFADFIAQARGQSSANWQNQFTAEYVGHFLRAGFEVIDQ